MKLIDITYYPQRDGLLNHARTIPFGEKIFMEHDHFMEQITMACAIGNIACLLEKRKAIMKSFIHDPANMIICWFLHDENGGNGMRDNAGGPGKTDMPIEQGQTISI